MDGQGKESTRSLLFVIHDGSGGGGGIDSIDGIDGGKLI